MFKAKEILIKEKRYMKWVNKNTNNKYVLQERNIKETNKHFLYFGNPLMRYKLYPLTTKQSDFNKEIKDGVYVDKRMIVMWVFPWHITKKRKTKITKRQIKK